jgi:hypothetical protein
LRRSVTNEELADDAVSGFAVLPVIKGIPVVVAASIVTVIPVDSLVLLVYCLPLTKPELFLTSRQMLAALWGSSY